MDLVVNTLTRIAEIYQLDPSEKSPIEIPNVGRDNLGALFRELGYTVGVELGVEAGLFSESLCKGNPDMKLYGVDSWTPYAEYREHVSVEKLTALYQEARERMTPYNFEIKVGFSMDVVKEFSDDSLDFVYIDANHTFPYFTQDLFYWAKKVRPGGIVAGHDFRKSKRKNTLNHVPYVVPCYMQAYRIQPWFLLGSKNVVPGEVRDKARSWMFVKE